MVPAIVLLIQIVTNWFVQIHKVG
ncbi:hypothetical protein [Virgibacillus sp. Bac330]